MRPNAVIYTSIDNGSYGSKVLRTPAIYKNSAYPATNSTIVQPCPGLGPMTQWNNYHLNNINSATQRYPAPLSSHASHHPPNGTFNVLRPSFQGNLPPPNSYQMPNGLTSCYGVHHFPNPNIMPTTNGYNALGPSNVNQQRINECAGIPLISNATSHLNSSLRQRQILRKMPLNTPGQTAWPVCSNTNFNNQNLATCKTLSQLAAHAQGSPLFANKDNKPTHWPGNNNNNMQHTAAAANNRYQNQNEINLNSNYQNSSLIIQSKENVNDANNLSSSSNEQPMESKDSNETCLPRIIKPRKRRKKDRKTANSGGLFVKIVPDFKESASSLASTSSSSPCMESKIQNDTIFHFPKKNNDHFLQANHRHDLPNHHNDLRHLGNVAKKCLIKENLRPSTDAVHHIDEVHGICFCNECDPLQSIWDYPLRSSSSEHDSSDMRSSLSRSSSTSSSLKSKSSSPSNLSDFSTEHIVQQTAGGDMLSDRAEFVGVIGSQRHNYFPLPKTKTKLELNNEDASSSDRETTSYNDILSGLNIATDLFHKTNKCLIDLNQEDSNATTSLNLHLGLLPETAETLLTESINEISRKLIETCSNESLVKVTQPKALTPPLGSFSTCSSSSSSSDFSNDSGIECNGSGSSSINSSAQINNCCNDLIFKFDSLHLIDANNNNQSNNNNNSNNAIANSSDIKQFPAKGKTINDNKNNSNNSESNQLYNASSNDINFHFPSSPTTLATHSPTSSSSSSASASSSSPPASLTFDFLFDMNNNNKNNSNNNSNDCYHNKMGLSSYYYDNLYNYDLKPKSKFLSPKNDSFDLMVWPNDTFDDDHHHHHNHDINFTNLSFLNNLEDNFKISTYSIT